MYQERPEVVVRMNKLESRTPASTRAMKNELGMGLRTRRVAALTLALSWGCSSGGQTSSEELSGARAGRSDGDASTPADGAVEAIEAKPDGGEEGASLDAGELPDANDVESADAEPRHDADQAPAHCTVDMLYEPNDTPTQACEIPLDQLVESETGPNDLNDYFVFELEKGHTYGFMHQALSPCTYRSSGELTLGDQVVQHLYGPNDLIGGSVAWRDVTAPTSGPALLKVGNQCRYNVRMLRSTDDGLVHDAASGEPNDTRATAAPVALGQTIYAVRPGGSNDDFYRVSVEAGATYEVALTVQGYCGGGVNIQMNLGADGTGQSLALKTIFQTSPPITSPAVSASGLAVLWVQTQCGYEVTMRRVP
jgi:hypothetical protein